MCAKPANLIWICHEGDAKDETTGRVFKSFEMDPKLIPIIPGFFNEVWHMEVQQQTGKESQYMVRTRSDMVYAARTSYSTLATIENQESIWGKVLAERKAAAEFASLVANTPMPESLVVKTK